MTEPLIDLTNEQKLIDYFELNKNQIKKLLNAYRIELISNNNAIDILLRKTVYYVLRVQMLTRDGCFWVESPIPFTPRMRDSINFDGKDIFKDALIKLFDFKNLITGTEPLKIYPFEWDEERDRI